jgi:hypothetical protein
MTSTDFPLRQRVTALTGVFLRADLKMAGQSVDEIEEDVNRRRVKMIRDLKPILRGDGTPEHMAAAIEALSSLLATFWLTFMNRIGPGRDDPDKINETVDAIISKLRSLDSPDSVTYSRQ